MNAAGLLVAQTPYNTLSFIAKNSSSQRALPHHFTIASSRSTHSALTPQG